MKVGGAQKGAEGDGEMVTARGSAGFGQGIKRKGDAGSEKCPFHRCAAAAERNPLSSGLIASNGKAITLGAASPFLTTFP